MYKDYELKLLHLQVEHQLLIQLVFMMTTFSIFVVSRGPAVTVSVNTCNIASFAEAVNVTYTSVHAYTHTQTHKHTSPTVKVNWVHVL